ncbi:ash family protein [Pseudomonas fluorescens]|nr:ash family protein [Pseudomonas fluorescens]MBD8226360.1 ash family protein [Pseudomonas fluorescens]MBD8784073.1 ash family protein [Pseudomonas fluorescens]MBD8816753.1 ash family protein [Pseudomonas fluorescens]
MTAMLMISDKRSITFVASNRGRRYGLPVAANSVTGRRNPRTSRRISAQITTAGVFFRPQLRVMAAVCGQASAWPGAYYPGIPTPCTAATQSRRKDGGGSSLKVGANHMHAFNPSKIRAAAHRAMALAALHANSSLATRLARYNAHMAIARTLESAGGVQ